MRQNRDDSLGGGVIHLGQHDESSGALDERPHRGAITSALDQVALPVGRGWGGPRPLAAGYGCSACPGYGCGDQRLGYKAYEPECDAAYTRSIHVLALRAGADK